MVAGGMACRRGRCVRWQARSPYPTDERSKVSRCGGAYETRRTTGLGSRFRTSQFAEIEVEVLLDWNSHSDSAEPCRLSLKGGEDRSQAPPNWLIAESSKAYAFTVQRPGDAELSAEDVQVQVEIKGKGSADVGSESWQQERLQSRRLRAQSGTGSLYRPAAMYSAKFRGCLPSSARG